MHPAIPHLIELQRVDHQMAVLRAELESFPKRLREADTKLSGARAEIASAKDALAKITTERKKFEFAGQEWKDRVRKYRDRKSTRLNSSHGYISYAVFCLKKKNMVGHGRQVITVCDHDVSRLQHQADDTLHQISA